MYMHYKYLFALIFILFIYYGVLRCYVCIHAHTLSLDPIYSLRQSLERRGDFSARIVQILRILKLTES